MASQFWKIALGYVPDGFHIIKHCDNEFTGKAQLGDLFMVKRGSSGDGSKLGYYHAGVYCSEEEGDIIHFTLSSSQSSSLWNIGSASSSSGQGVVSKVSVDVFCGNDKFAIYRKDTGISRSFKNDVRNAMKRAPQYNLAEYNCIHFALELLQVPLEIISDYFKRFMKIINKTEKMEMALLTA